MRQLLLIIILLTTLLTFGQSYEGTLTYVTDIEVSEKLVKMGMTKQILLDKMKNEGSWSDTIRTSYKQGNYYTLLNNNPKSWAIFRADSNKIYSLQDGEASDICTVTDASIDLEFTMTGEMPKVDKLDTTVNIDGVSCSIVRVKWKSGTYDYYYNQTELKVDGSLYAKHTTDGWAEFLKISNALPRRIVKSVNGMMTITMTLTKSKPEVVDEKLFIIPKLVPDENLNIVKIADRKMMRIEK